MGINLYDLIIKPLFDGLKENIIDVFASWLDVMLELARTPFEFDWASTVMTYFQAFSIIVVFIIVIVKGIVNGVLINGGSEDESVGHYLFQSFVPIAIIAALPTIVGTITAITTGMVEVFGNYVNGNSLASSLVDNVADSFEFQNGVIVPGVSDGFFIKGICLIAVIYYLASITLQCVKRWIQLVVLSVISPLLAIFTATEDNGDFLSILRSMVAIGVITILQLLLLQSVPALGNIGANIGGESATIGHTVGLCCFTIAGLAAVKQVPSWIERYTFASSVAGKGGVSHTFIAAARGISPRGSAASGAGSSNVTRAVTTNAARRG